MTVKEYNDIYNTKYSNLICFISNIDSAMSKIDDYENAMIQLECIGWDNECKDFIKQILDYYMNNLKKEIKYERIC